MADSLYELLSSHTSAPLERDSTTAKYLTRLSTLSLSSLTLDEPSALAQAAHSNLAAFQSLAARSNTSLVASASHLNHLASDLPYLYRQTESLRDQITPLDESAVHFADKYSRLGSTDNNPDPASLALRTQGTQLLQQRKQAQLLARNVDRIADILDLPILLTTALSNSSSGTTSTDLSATAPGSNYTSVLDLHALIRRLHNLHPQSSLLREILHQSDDAIRTMLHTLTTTLSTAPVKLAHGMRIISHLRRIAPELDAVDSLSNTSTSALPLYFLLCRLHMLETMLAALEPLRALASESSAQGRSHHAERYLKRYIETFREHSFAIISMYRSIFPTGRGASIDGGTESGPRINKDASAERDASPSALATFPLHLVTQILIPTLQEYLPLVKEPASRDSLVTQLLYCAGSWARLGADFSVLLGDFVGSQPLYTGRGQDTAEPAKRSMKEEKPRSERRSMKEAKPRSEKRPMKEAKVKEKTKIELETSAPIGNGADEGPGKQGRETSQGLEDDIDGPTGETDHAVSNTNLPSSISIDSDQHSALDSDLASDAESDSDSDTAEDEYIAAMKRHRLLAGKLDRMAAGGRVNA